MWLCAVQHVKKNMAERRVSLNKSSKALQVQATAAATASTAASDQPAAASGEGGGNAVYGFDGTAGHVDESVPKMARPMRWPSLASVEGPEIPENAEERDAADLQPQDRRTAITAVYGSMGFDDDMLTDAAAPADSIQIEIKQS